MGALLEKAANVTGPIITPQVVGGALAADTTGLTGVMRIAVTGAAQSFALPAATSDPQKKSTMGKRFLRLVPVGVNVQLAQGAGAAPTIVLNQVSVIGTGHVGAGASFFNGVPDQWEIDQRATHVGFIGDAATGFLEYYISDGAGRL